MHALTLALLLLGSVEAAAAVRLGKAADRSAVAEHQTGEKLPVLQSQAGTWRGPLWFFAASHKAGTVLLHSLATIQAGALGLRICSGTCGGITYFGELCEVGESSVSERTMFFCNAGAADLDRARRVAGEQLRAVQVIRDPLAMVASGYVYDMYQAPEADDLHADKSMRRMNLSQGLAVEAAFAVRSVLPEMLNVYRNGRAHGDTLVLRMEDFLASSESFDETAARLFNYTLGGLPATHSRAVLETTMLESAAREDVHRHPVPDGPSFISPIALKAQAQSAMESLPADLLEQLREYRRELGYPADL